MGPINLCDVRIDERHKWIYGAKLKMGCFGVYMEGKP